MSDGHRPPPPLPRTITITGTGRVSVAPDFAGHERMKLAMADAATPIEAGTNEIVIGVAMTFLIE
jgi:uncharacterized protein YggE